MTEESRHQGRFKNEIKGNLEKELSVMYMISR